MKAQRYLIISIALWATAGLSIDSRCSPALLEKFVQLSGAKVITVIHDWQRGSLPSVDQMDSRHAIREKLTYPEFERLLKLATLNVVGFEPGWRWMDKQSPESQIYMFGGILRNLIRDMNQYLKLHSAEELEQAILEKKLQPAFDRKDADILVPDDLVDDVEVFPDKIVMHKPGLRAAVPEFMNLYYELLPYTFYQAALEGGGIAIDKIAVNPKGILDPHEALKAYYGGWLPVDKKFATDFWKTTYPVGGIHFYRTKDAIRMADAMLMFPEAAVPKHMLDFVLKSVDEDLDPEHGLTEFSNSTMAPHSAALGQTVKKAAKMVDGDLIRFFKVLFETRAIKICNKFNVPGFEREMFKGLPDSHEPFEKKKDWYDGFMRRLVEKFTIEEISLIDHWVPIFSIALGEHSTRWTVPGEGLSTYLQIKPRLDLASYAKSPGEIMASIRNLRYSNNECEDGFFELEWIRTKFFLLKPTGKDISDLGAFTFVTNRVLKSYVDQAISEKIITPSEGQSILKTAASHRNKRVATNEEWEDANPNANRKNTLR